MKAPFDGAFIDGAPEFEHSVDGIRTQTFGIVREVHLTLAKSADERGDLAQARSHLERLMTLDRLDGLAALELTATLAKLGDSAGAIRLARAHIAAVRSSSVPTQIRLSPSLSRKSRAASSPGRFLPPSRRLAGRLDYKSRRRTLMRHAPSRRRTRSGLARMSSQRLGQRRSDAVSHALQSPRLARFWQRSRFWLCIDVRPPPPRPDQHCRQPRHLRRIQSCACRPRRRETRRPAPIRQRLPRVRRAKRPRRGRAATAGEFSSLRSRTRRGTRRSPTSGFWPRTGSPRKFSKLEW